MYKIKKITFIEHPILKNLSLNFCDANGDAVDTIIFAGENEIFYKDIKKYVEKVKKENVNVKLIIGPELYHIYPLFPIPEAKKAFKVIKNELK